MGLFNKDIFQIFKGKKTSELTEKSNQAMNTRNSGLRCDRCRCVLTNDNIVLEKKAHLCTECSEKIKALKKQLDEIDKIVKDVVAASGTDASDEGIGRIKNSVEKFIERYITDEIAGYRIYDFSSSANFTSVKLFEKYNGIWCVNCHNNTKEPAKTETYFPEINDENLIEEFTKILLNEEKIAAKSSLIRYEEERTDKNGLIYLACTGEWEFSEFYYNKAKNEFIEKKYHHEYLDTGTVFEGSLVVTANKIYGVFSGSKDVDLIRMLRMCMKDE